MRHSHVRRFAVIGLCGLSVAFAAHCAVAAAAEPPRHSVTTTASNLDSDDPVAGVGLALKQDAGDDYPMVQNLIAGGSASEDGNIKVGDLIVGIEKEDGSILDFKGKPLMEIVLEIRGPVDTKVKLVVRHKGEDGKKTYELTRKPLPDM
jgi:C-terminal processing protease CtpA/Prc